MLIYLQMLESPEEKEQKKLLPVKMTQAVTSYMAQQRLEKSHQRL